MQLVFVIDTSRGMADHWHALRRACFLFAQSCAHQQPALSQQEFAIVLASADSVPSDFTSDIKRLARWLKELKCVEGLLDGGVLLEGLLASVNCVPWRPNATRHVVLISHVPPRPLAQPMAEMLAAAEGLPLATRWSPVPESLARARIVLSAISVSPAHQPPGQACAQLSSLYQECCSAGAIKVHEPAHWPAADFRVLVFTSFPPPRAPEHPMVEGWRGRLMMTNQTLCRARVLVKDDRRGRDVQQQAQYWPLELRVIAGKKWADVLSADSYPFALEVPDGAAPWPWPLPMGHGPWPRP